MKRSLKSWIWRIGVATLTPLGLMAAIYYGWQAGGETTKGFTPKTDGPLLPAGSKEKLQADAERCLQSFWRAGGYETKAAFVRERKRVVPLMRNYYLDHRRRDPEQVALQSTNVLTIGPSRVVHFIFKAKFISGPERMVEAALVEDKNGLVRLDWESYLGIGEMDWADFRKQRPTQPVRLRAYLTSDKYYNFEFEDSSRYAAVRLDNAEGDQTLHAYCERGSSEFARIAAMLQRNEGRPSPVTVVLSFPKDAKSDNCVKLEKLVAESWLVLD